MVQDSGNTDGKSSVTLAGTVEKIIKPPHPASIRQDDDSRQAIYGPKVTTRALLLGKVPAPSAAQPFLAEIRGAKAQAVDEGKTEAKAEAKE